MQKIIKKKVLLTSQYSISDPPLQNAVKMLHGDGHEIIYVERLYNNENDYPAKFILSLNIAIKEKNIYPVFIPIPNKKYSGIKIIDKIVNQYLYQRKLNKIISVCKPDIVIVIMFHPIAAIKRIKGIKYIVGITDIPPRINIGKFDRFIYNSAIRKIIKWDHIWASDEFKAKLLKLIANLDILPAVCYNCPTRDYFEDFGDDISKKWLKKQLLTEGYKVEEDTIVILRAGAFGEHGGIEETIEALRIYDGNYLFLILGRPEPAYEEKINSIIKDAGLSKKVALWCHPDDFVWKKALIGADIGHLIQVFDKNTKSLYNELNTLNSALSANRIYQYLAAGLPIISFDDKRLAQIHAEIDCFFVCETSVLVDSVKHALDYFNKHPEWLNKASQNARKAFIEKYNWEYQFQKISKLLN